ncbi:MAG TPA: PEP-CTERM sorting domain-containing protein [Verrucomicrobiae bacterium]
MKRLAILLTLAPLCLWGDVRYTITQLVPNDSAIGNSSAGRLNEVGDVVGGFFNGTALHGFLYTDQLGFSDLGSGPLGILNVNGINSAGQISAYGPVSAGGTHAFRYTPGIGFVDLGTAAGQAAETTDINNSGQVIGTYTANDGTDHAFRYSDGVGMEYLGLSSAQFSAARGINGLGWVTGTSDNRAFLYRDDVGAVDIGAGSGWGINNTGVVVGEDSSLHPVMYLNGQMIPLGGIGRATGINNFNLVVGTVDADSFMHGFVWSQEEGMLDLNSLIDPNSGWFIASAGRVNDAGQIVGWGFSLERGNIPTPFRLDPIPEPSTWTLLILGTGAFCFLRRRRNPR